jgi:hypothetical protein
MDDEFAASKPRFTWRRVLFALAAVFTFTLTAFPLGSYGLGYFAGTVAVAAALRLIYIKLLRRRANLELVSGWVFVIAFVIAVLGAPGRLHTDKVEAASSSAEKHGLVASADDATPLERCLGVALDDWETMPQLRQTWPKPQYRQLASRVCEQAEREGVLRRDGRMLERDLQPILSAVYADMQAEARTAR